MNPRLFGYVTEQLRWCLVPAITRQAEPSVRDYCLEARIVLEAAPPPALTLPQPGAVFWTARCVSLENIERFVCILRSVKQSPHERLDSGKLSFLVLGDSSVDGAQDLSRAVRLAIPCK